jgi:hypothetical protein
MVIRVRGSQSGYAVSQLENYFEPPSSKDLWIHLIGLEEAANSLTSLDGTNKIPFGVLKQ